MIITLFLNVSVREPFVYNKGMPEHDNDWTRMEGELEARNSSLVHYQKKKSKTWIKELPKSSLNGTVRLLQCNDAFKRCWRSDIQ